MEPPAPTLAGFTNFIYSTMGIDPTNLPTNSQIIADSFQMAQDTVNPALACLPTSIYSTTVYNLAGSILLNFAQDQMGRMYFTQLRGTLNMTSFQPGVVSSTSDTSTSTTLLNGEFMKNLTLADLQLLKDPYGRAYLAVAQAYGDSIVELS